MDTPLLTAPFSARASLREGWKLVRGTKLAVLSTILPMFLVMLVAFIALTQIIVLHPANGPYASLFYTLLSPLFDAILLSGFVGGLVMIGVKRARHQAVSCSEGLKYFNKLPKLATIAYIETLIILLLNNIVLFVMAFVLLKALPHNQAISSAITLVLILLIGLGVKTCFVFSFQFALDKQLSVLTSIGRSIKTVGHHYWKILAIVIVVMFVNLLGACLAGVGLFWTLPFSYNTLGIVYRELAEKGL